MSIRGSVSRLIADARIFIVNIVQAVAKEQSLAPAPIALAWLLSKPVVTAPIVGASKLRHLDDAIAAADIELNDDAIQRLEAPYVPRAIMGLN